MMYIDRGTTLLQLEKLGKYILSFLVMLLLICPTYAETVTLQWTTWGPEPLDRQLIEAFEREHPNIRIEYIPGSGDYRTKLKVLAASGVSPDVFAVDGIYLVEFASAGLMMPIDDLLAKETSFQMEEFFPASLPDVQYKGRTYGLPYISAPLYMLYNVDHLNEAGLAKPDMHWDRSTFETYVRALTRTESDRVFRYGTTQLLQWGSHAFWPWIWSEGGRVFSEDKRRFMMADATAVSVLDWMSQLSQERIAGPGNFRQETASMTAIYPGGFPSVRGEVHPFEWDVVIHPEGPGGQYSIWKGNVMAISPSSEHKDEAWTFLKWLLSPRGRGYQIYIANKRFPPSTRDLELWQLYQGVGEDPQSLYESTLLLATQYGRPIPHLLQSQEIFGLIGQLLQRIATGQKAAQLATEEIRPVIEQLLSNEPE